MIAHRKDEILRDAELLGDLSQRSSLVVADVAESRVNIIPDHSEIRD